MKDFFENIKNADELHMSSKMVDYLLRMIASRENSTNCCFHNLIIKLSHHSVEFTKILERNGLFEVDGKKVYSIDPQAIIDYLMGICMLSKFLYPMIEQIDTVIDKELKITIREEDED